MKIPHDRVTVKVGPPAVKRFANRMFAKNIDGKQGIFKALYFRSVGREYRAFLIAECGKRILMYRLIRSNYRELTLSILVLTVVCLAGCARKSDQQQTMATRWVTDDLGRRVELPQHVSRAISLAPSITESIFAAGAGDRLVGVTTYCNYPAETARIEKIGDTLSPNIEKIIALKPEVVFVSTASQLEAFMQTLDDQRIAVYVIDSKSVTEVLDALRKIGKLFGTESSAETTTSALEKRVNVVERRLPPEASQRVFVQISSEPLFTIGQDSFLTNLIEIAGGTSVTRNVPSAYPKLSKESASALNPNVIILSNSEDNQAPNDVFKNSPAVKNGRVYKINADIISRPGPRLVDAIEQIADFLHGEKS